MRYRPIHKITLWPSIPRILARARSYINHVLWLGLTFKLWYRSTREWHGKMLLSKFGLKTPSSNDICRFYRLFFEKSRFARPFMVPIFPRRILWCFRTYIIYFVFIKSCGYHKHLIMKNLLWEGNNVWEATEHTCINFSSSTSSNDEGFRCIRKHAPAQMTHLRIQKITNSKRKCLRITCLIVKASCEHMAFSKAEKKQILQTLRKRAWTSLLETEI